MSDLTTSVWDERIKVGMIVEITGYTVKGRGYGDKDTTRVRWTLPARQKVKVMVLGRSYRFSGKLRGDYDGRWLEPTESHPVWMVQPLKGMQYRKPLPVYQDQIVLPELPPGAVSLEIHESGEGSVPEMVMPAEEEHGAK